MYDKNDYKELTTLKQNNTDIKQHKIINFFKTYWLLLLLILIELFIFVFEIFNKATNSYENSSFPIFILYLLPIAVYVYCSEVSSNYEYKSYDNNLSLSKLIIIKHSYDIDEYFLGYEYKCLIDYNKSRKNYSNGIAKYFVPDKYLNDKHLYNEYVNIYKKDLTLFVKHCRLKAYCSDYRYELKLNHKDKIQFMLLCEEWFKFDFYLYADKFKYNTTADLYYKYNDKYFDMILSFATFSLFMKNYFCYKSFLQYAISYCNHFDLNEEYKNIFVRMYEPEKDKTLYVHTYKFNDLHVFKTEDLEFYEENKYYFQ